MAAQLIIIILVIPLCCGVLVWPMGHLDIHAHTASRRHRHNAQQTPDGTSHGFGGPSLSNNFAYFAAPSLSSAEVIPKRVKLISKCLPSSNWTRITASRPRFMARTFFEGIGLWAQHPSTVQFIHGTLSSLCPSTKSVGAFKMATPAGLEPATTCLEGRCSIQLSYGA